MKTPRDQLVERIKAEIQMCKDVLRMLSEKEYNNYIHERKTSWISRLSAFEEILQIIEDGTPINE